MKTTSMAGHLIRRLHQHSTQVFLKKVRAAGFDLTSVQFAALDALRSHPGIDQARLSSLIAYDRATIGGVIDRLERKGLLKREISRHDRRAREVRLTEEGLGVVTAMTPIVERLQRDILDQLSPEETQVLLNLLKKALGRTDLD